MTRIPLLFAAPTAVAGGLLLFAAYPGTSNWVLMFVGVALILAALWQQRGRHGFWIGLLAGAAFWLPLIRWLTLYLGLVPWAALAGAMILWFILMGGVVSGATRIIALRGWGSVTTMLAQSALVSGAWVLRETIQSSFPYSGFAWGRLAHTQAEGPLLSLVSFTGFAGLTGVIVLLIALPLAAVFRVQNAGKRSLLTASVGTLGVVVTVTLLSWVPAASLTVTETARIAAVQGNSQSGVFDDRENGDVIADHVRVTEEWLDTDPGPIDAVVWPENSAEFGIIEHAENLSTIRSLARDAGAPFVVGSIIGEGPEDDRRYTNSAVVVDPESPALQRFDKRHPVPFAEYMPHRAFYRALVPDLVDMVQLEYEHGVTDTVLPVGDLRAGIAICFDIIFDDMAVAMMDEDAQIVFAPTNNADFGQTDQSEQQLFIAKLRAVEMGRAVVNISTVATSEIIAPDGAVLASIPQWEPGVMVADVPLVTGTTPAVEFGAVIAGAWIALGVVASMLSLVRLQQHTRPRRRP